MQNQTENQPAKSHYSKAEFWDQRYVQKGGFFDWYAQYPQLKYCFQNQYGMSFNDSILMVGCGNSKLSQQMFDAGYKNIVNIDISPAVIQQMKQHSPQMEWLVMDATQMTFESNKFDFVIDKGTMDALIAGRDLTPTTKLLKQCMRVTKEQGQLILITYGSPEGRKKIFQTSLEFNMFDYYFCFVNLNDMSTMINLMRNNSIGPNGQPVSKTQSLQRSMKEFMMIKIMRQRRSKQKQFVVWENYMKKINPVIAQKIQQALDSKNTSLSTIQNSQSKQQNQANQDIEEKKKQQDAPKISYLSKPQKQSYVYSYSIKRKFAYDYKLPQNFQHSQNKLYEGSQQMSLFQLKGSQNVNNIIKNSVQYCKNKQISHSGVVFKNLQQNFQQNQKSIKINISEGPGVKINILKKTNIQLKIIFINLQQVIQKLKGINNYLLEKVGLVMHPCPKTYSLFSMIKNKMKVKTVNQLLNKFWYSTYIIQSVDMINTQINVTISVPPVLPNHLNVIVKSINQYFSTLKQSQIKIKNIRNGFVSFPDLSLFAVLNLASLSHNKGIPLQVLINDFWQNQNQSSNKHQQQGQSNLYILNNTHIKVDNTLLPYVILHILCIY